MRKVTCFSSKISIKYCCLSVFQALDALWREERKLPAQRQCMEGLPSRCWDLYIWAVCAYCTLCSFHDCTSKGLPEGPLCQEQTSFRLQRSCVSLHKLWWMFSFVGGGGLQWTKPNLWGKFVSPWHDSHWAMTDLKMIAGPNRGLSAIPNWAYTARIQYFKMPLERGRVGHLK